MDETPGEFEVDGRKWVLGRSPHLTKDIAGTVGVTALGMYASG